MEVEEKPPNTTLYKTDRHTSILQKDGQTMQPIKTAQPRQVIIRFRKPGFFCNKGIIGHFDLFFIDFTLFIGEKPLNTTLYKTHRHTIILQKDRQTMQPIETAPPQVKIRFCRKPGFFCNKGFQEGRGTGSVRYQSTHIILHHGMTAFIFRSCNSL